MEKEILVNVEFDETRVAVIEDGKLVEMYIERPQSQRLVGNIYKGKVENVLPGMEAAFVNIGLEKNAFLYVDDAYPNKPEADEEQSEKTLKNLTIRELVSEGQEIIVQVAKEPTGTKGARVTRSLTVPGRYAVLMPNVDYIGISRRIQDEKERDRLKQLAQKAKPNETGLIVRTVAEGKGEEELNKDILFLQGVWGDIQLRAKRNKAPYLLHKDMSLTHRVIRDLLSDDVDRLYVDEAQEYQKMTTLVESFSPHLRDRIRLYRNGSIFDRFGVEEELERALKRRVWLDCGGYLVIDQTEALTVIDVNTGKFVGSENLEATVLHTNLQAAEEIARQVRLRDIGGIIIIDFIDMDSVEHRQQVVKALEKALERDRTRATVLGITQLGLVEMTRKKGRKSVRDILTRECPYCEAKGRVLSEETVSRKLRREIKKIMKNSGNEAILVEVHPSVASLLIGPGGSNLKQLEDEISKTIYIRGSEDCHIEEMQLRAIGDKEDVEQRALPVKTGQVLTVQVLEPHVSNAGDGIARVEGYVIDIEGAGNRVGQNVEIEVTKAFRTYAKARVVSIQK